MNKEDEDKEEEHKDVYKDKSIKMCKDPPLASLTVQVCNDLQMLG